MMKYCKNCDVKYKSDINKCLICNSTLEELNNGFEDNYPTYVKKGVFKKHFYNFFLLLNIISIIATLFVDYSVNKSLYFSLIVSSSNIYLIIFLKLILSNRSFVLKSFRLTFINVSYIILLGHILRSVSWALDIVFPSMLILNTLILLITTFVKRNNWQKYFIFLLISVLSNLLIILLNIFNISNTTWLITTSFLLGLSVLIFLLIFTPKDVKEEIKRRFHL